MGVAGLWEVLRPAGQVRSLTELAVEDGFNANSSRQRGFRIGVDASIWFFHAAYGREGENPELRTLFFRCCRLLQSPLLPLFVFDGPNRPAVKRGKRVGGNAHWLTQGMKNIIDAFGFEWRVAPGEAEAELAYLNRVGIIDAVLSDDVDNFLFGATMVIRNPSNTLSGNRAHPVKNSQGKDDGNHVVTYTAHAIISEPSVSLSRAGMILIGLLSGGDYIPVGLPGCGQKFATALARAGFGDSLVKAVKELRGSQLDKFLDQWRQDIRNELKTNKSGFLPSKKPSLAASLPDDFPSLPVLMSYADPVTSENTPRKSHRKVLPDVWRNDPDPMQIASLCELYFEWGVKDVIVQRFRTVLWPGIVCRAVRRAVMNEDTYQQPPVDALNSDGEEEGLSLSTKRISSALSLSSPLKKPSAAGASTSDLLTSECFTLSILASLTSPALPSSFQSTSLPLTSSTSKPPPLLLEVLSQRAHASTDSTLEYRVLVDPTVLVERAESGIKGIRPPLVGGLFGIDPEDESEDQGTDDGGSDDDGSGIERLETAGTAAKLGTKKRKMRREVPTTPLRLWLPACMIRAAAPALEEAYEAKVRAREEKKAKRGHSRAGTKTKSTSGRTKAKDVRDNFDDESVPRSSAPDTASGPKAKAKGVGITGGRRRKPKQVSEAQDDAYEFIDLNVDASACSSSGDGGGENIKGKGKIKTNTGRVYATKTTRKASANTNAANGNAATANTLNDAFKTTKPSAVGVTKYKSFKVASRRIYEEEASTDVFIPPPLPKSTRPLDVLRAKSKSSTVPLSPTFEPKVSIPRYEKELSSSLLPPRPSKPKPGTSSLPPRPIQPTLQARKKPLFIDVSDTDSDIEVSDARQLLSSTTTAHDVGDMSVGAGTGQNPLSLPRNGLGRTMNGITDPTTKGNAPKSKSALSTSMSTVSPPSKRPISTPLSTDTSINSAPGSTTGPPPVLRSAPKLVHIPLPHSGVESGEEAEDSGDELPTFQCGSARSKGKKKRETIFVRPVPQPFPIQFASESPESPHAIMLGQRCWSRGDDEHDDGDEVEIVDVFTTPRGPSPPRSPTPSPSSVEQLPVHALAGPAKLRRSSRSGRFPTSPTKVMSRSDAELHEKVKQHRCASSDRDTHVPGDQRDGIHKSPRKSVAHSSPRHNADARVRAASPTPSALSNSTSRPSYMLWTDDGSGASDGHQSRSESSRSMQTNNEVGQKPRSSDTSAIYISSGSEDEGGAGPDPNIARGERGANEDQNECTDGDAGEWANRAMILSAPPSPALSPRSLPADGPDLIVPTAEETLPQHARASKFKPARAVASKVDMRATSAGCQAGAKTTSRSIERTTHDRDTIVRRAVHGAPLLVARAKGSKSRIDDIIDLASD